mmetsp:Transcript_24298/g.63768  ORF Transcript_24298/g.63768 Transcript_24298/m.63768 type:complete len:744 (-) Transcript_24298:107-2338(-)
MISSDDLCEEELEAKDDVDRKSKVWLSADSSTSDCERPLGDESRQVGKTAEGTQVSQSAEESTDVKRYTRTSDMTRYQRDSTASSVRVGVTPSERPRQARQLWKRALVTQKALTTHCRHVGEVVPLSSRPHSVTPILGKVWSWSTRTSLCKIESLRVSSNMFREVQPEFVRAVRLDHVLAGCGWIWDLRSKVADCDLSRLVEHLHVFISHDWHTQRLQKFLALCFIFNSRAALWSSVLVALLCSVVPLSFPGLFPCPVLGLTAEVIGGETHAFRHDCLVVLLPPCTFAFVFMEWQRIRSLLLRRPVMAFVDRLCIDQSNQVRKEKGIRALAGVLRYSGRLLILWSPQYFTRLWCAYEVASWLYLGRELDESIFMPVTLACSFVMWSVAFVCFWVLQEVTTSDVVVQTVLPPVVMLLLALPLTHLLRVTCHDQQLLTEQLASFSIRGTQCFCCDHGHEHPTSKKHLRCDRLLVYKTLERWWLEDLPSLLEEEHLDAFDEHVRKTFATSVTRGWIIPLNYQDALFMSAPFSWALMHRIFWSVHHLDAHAGCRFVAEGFILWVAVGPFILFMLFTLTMLSNRLCVPGQSSILVRALQGLVLTGSITGLFVGIVSLLSLTRRWRHPAPQLTGAVVMLLLILVIFRTSLLPKGRPRRIAPSRITTCEFTRSSFATTALSMSREASERRLQHNQSTADDCAKPPEDMLSEGSPPRDMSESQVSESSTWETVDIEVESFPDLDSFTFGVI